MSKTTKTSGAKVVFFGNERLATGVTTTTPLLRWLIEAGYEVCAVVTNYEAGTSRQARQLEIAEVAKEHGIPVLIPDKLSEIKEQLESYGAEVGVLAAYGKIVPQSIIDIFPKGIINLHPSLLPQYRGSTPIEAAILNGDAKTGMSLMLLVKEMDAGPVFMQRTIDLKGNESKQELYDSLIGLGKEMLAEVLPKYITGDIKLRQQSHPSRATYTGRLSKTEGQIDWSKPAAQIEREIRAYADWPKSRAQLGNIDVIITEATLTQSSALATQNLEAGKAVVDGKRLLVNTGDGLLEIQKLKPAGKAEMTSAEFIRGYLRS